MSLGLALSFLFYVVALQMQNQGCNGCLENERIGLLDIKAYIVAQDGDSDHELDSWVGDKTSNCCNWNRVECSNMSTGHVTQLSLHHLFNVPYQGPRLINGSLFRPFKELLSLDLSSNWFNGWIGKGLPRLMKLETLDLSHNSLNSSILLGLNGLTSLKTLKLNHNSMNGFFSPQDIKQLQRLKVLDLSNNNLNGSIKGLCKMQELIELGLSSNKFGGQIPECLSILKNLQVLDLSQNLFSGNFPSFIRNITSLTYLSLFGNYLEGLFSLSTLANHSKLQVLYIYSQSPKAHVETEKTQWFPTFQLKSLILRSCNLNMDKGSTIPSFLLYQKDLEFIDLSQNKLVGAFPSWLIQNNSKLKTFLSRNNSFAGNFQLSSIRSDMSHLDISNNNISGLLPKYIGVFLPKLIILNMSMNNFEGNIPTSIGKMQQLLFLDISHNRFSDELHEQVAVGCIMLTYMKLSNNFLQGNIPKFSNLMFLSQLYLNNNNFHGTVKQVFANLESKMLEVLDISNNSITGEIPGSIGKFSSLRLLLMAENQLEGEIPFGFSNLTRLCLLDLSQNRLFGSVSHFNLSSMKFLYLQKNGFSGSIPSTLFEGSQLVTLDLRDNNFSGHIPYWMDKLSNLRVLLLGGNNFQSHIPTQLCQLEKITIMDLSRNKIKGSIPSCFNNLSFGMVENDYHGPIFQSQRKLLEDHSQRHLFFNVSVSLFTLMDDFRAYDELATVVEFRTKHNYYSYGGNILENMAGMDLSCNMLIGVIPSQIGNLQQIRALNLSHNSLSGFIPDTFSSLHQIESLDLSYNNLSGEIPSQLTQLNFLSIFNVSYNNLSGTPPSTGQFGNFDEDNYRGNHGLCGQLLKRKCEGVAASPPSQFNNTQGKETTVDMVAFYWSFAAAYITILLGFIAVLCINAHWRMTWFYFIGKVIRRCFPTFPMY